MIPWVTVDQTTGPDGTALSLHQRGHEWVIRAGGKDLMSNLMHGSEEEMARRARPPAGGRVLIGGLGMGYTVRAALDGLPDRAAITVAELSPAVVRWNEGPLGPLAAHPARDPRVTLHLGDVRGPLWGAPKAWDVVLLDVDNGPDGMTQADNDALYALRGLRRSYEALRPGGVLVVWSAHEAPEFEKRMAQAGFAAEAVRVRARAGGKGPRHVLFFGRRTR
jgi:spermidine synthase